jgi:hypothetical protein
MRVRRETFLQELMADVTVYPYTKETAMLAGKIDKGTAKQGRGDSLRRLAHCRDGVVTRFFDVDSESASFSENTWSHGCTTLAAELLRSFGRAEQGQTERSLILFVF